MEPRLITAYILIALMAAFLVVGIIAFRRNRAKAKRRDAGFGKHMQ